MPLAISEPEAVAGYVLMHYWDNMDFTDTARVADDAFMERHFARYLSAFPYASPDDARKAVAGLMKRAEADTAAYHRVMDVAERFLTSPNSSMRDEELYYLFLSAVDSSPFLDSDRRVRVRAQIEDVKKNRIVPIMHKHIARHRLRLGYGKRHFGNYKIVDVAPVHQGRVGLCHGIFLNRASCRPCIGTRYRQHGADEQ